MSSPNLGIVHVASAQSQKEVVVNAAVDALDKASNGKLSVAMADANQTLSAAQFTGSGIFECTGAMTANRNLTVPNTLRVFIVNNKTTGGFSVVVKSGSGSTVSVGAGAQQLYCDAAGDIVSVA